MAGKLTDKFMDQLEQWIATGPKTFDLLYSITRDGCSNVTFHQKCDNQGPTVTVLYNQQGSVYGGYTTLNWDQSGSWGNDAAAFLFRLQYSGTAAVNKFPCKTATQAVYRDASYGPVFGTGNGLCSFTGTVNNSGGYYALNGNMNGLSTSYNNQGIAANQINNGTMNVTELEVYQVKDGKRKALLDKPWRKTPEWNMEFNPSVPISPEIPGFKKNTTLKDRIHCVCIVIDGSTAGVLPEKMLEKIKAIQAKMQLRRVPQMVLLTKIDKVCPSVEADTSQVFKSEAVLEQVNKISQLLGIPRNHVLPVKNYETEIELSDNVNILALLTVRQLLRATEDYMFNFLDDVGRDFDNAKD